MRVALVRYQVFRREGLVFCGNHATEEQAINHAVRLARGSSDELVYDVYRLRFNDSGTADTIIRVWCSDSPF